MASVNLCVIPSRINADGTLTIKVAVKNKRATSYINTRYKIDSLSEWKNGRVINRPDAVLINKRLYEILFTYTDILEKSINEALSAAEIRQQLILRTSGRNGICGYRDIFMKRLKTECSKSYFTNFSYTFKSLIDCFGESFAFEQFNAHSLKMYENYLRQKGQSDTTINIRMSHVKAFINSAIADGVVKYEADVFAKYTAPAKNVRDSCISHSELVRLRDAKFDGTAERRYTIARDLFMLSFYCGGINLTDLLGADMSGECLTFIRKKTAHSKRGDKDVSITIQPEARAIIDKYINSYGRLELDYHYSNYSDLRSFITRSLNRIGNLLGFEKKLMFYSARKTFCQFGYELGIPLYILEYSIGQTIKEANNRPIFDYIRLMRQQADIAIRAIIDHSLSEQ